MPDLVFSSMTRLAAAIRAGHVSAAAVLEAPLAQNCEPGVPLRVDDQDAAYWLVSAHGTVFNPTGHPAVVLPYTRDRDGLPIGVQLVGTRWDESRLLGVAQALSPVTGACRRPPGY